MTRRWVSLAGGFCIIKSTLDVEECLPRQMLQGKHGNRSNKYCLATSDASEEHLYDT